MDEYVQEKDQTQGRSIFFFQFCLSEKWNSSLPGRQTSLAAQRVHWRFITVPKAYTGVAVRDIYYGYKLKTIHIQAYWLTP